MGTVGRHAVLTAVALVFGIALVIWVRPETTPGAVFLIAVLVAVVNAVGALAGIGGKDAKALPWIILPAALALSAGCEKHAPVPVGSAPATAQGQGAVAGRVAGAISGSQGALAGAMIGAAAGFPSSVRLYPTRTYLRSEDIPPREAAAYGVVALTSLVTPDTEARLRLFCRGFVASLPTMASAVTAVPLREQMVTVWPLQNPEHPRAISNDCDYLLANYDLNAGHLAIRDAENQQHRLTGRGPFLIGWAPSHTRGVPDAVVLVIDMSGYETPTAFLDAFGLWKTRIVEDRDLWRPGFRMDELRIAVRNFADHYGPRILAGIKYWAK